MNAHVARGVLISAGWLGLVLGASCRHDLEHPNVDVEDPGKTGVSPGVPRTGDWLGVCAVNTGFRFHLSWAGTANCSLQALAGDTTAFPAACGFAGGRLTLKRSDGNGDALLTCEQQAATVNVLGKGYADTFRCTTYQNNLPSSLATWGCEIVNLLPPGTDPASLGQTQDNTHLPDVGTQPASSVCAFHNPVLPPGSIDPWVKAVDGTYYVVLTGGGAVTLRATTYLQEMGSAAANVIWQASADSATPFKRDIAGAKLYKFDHLWYLYLSGKAQDAGSDGQRLFVLQSAGDDPRGPYSFAAKLGGETPSYAPSVYSNGTSRYLLWSQDDAGGRCLYIASMRSPTELGSVGSRISCPLYAFEKVGGISRNDDPEMFTHDGSNVMVITFSAGSPTDPNASIGVLYKSNDWNGLTAGWRKPNAPIFKQNGKVFTLGHMVFTKGPGGSDDWFLYHGSDDPAGDPAHRALHMQPFSWNEENLPLFEQPEPADRALPCPR